MKIKTTLLPNFSSQVFKTKRAQLDCRLS